MSLLLRTYEGMTRGEGFYKPMLEVVDYLEDNDFTVYIVSDTERENGSEEKAQKMYDLCEEFDWVPIYMKNDWTTIYGDGVTYIKE